MINRAALALVLAIGLWASASPAQDHRPPPGAGPAPDMGIAPPGGPRFSFANPSGIIALELAQARALRERGAKGLKEALKTYVAEQAVIFAPDATPAVAYSRKAGTLPIAPERSPYGVWMSCDASQAIVQGAWRRGDASGYFVSVWERQEKGAYKWVLTREDAAVTPAEAPEMLSARVARCRGRYSVAIPPAAGKGGKAAPRPPAKPGHARDETLRWEWRESPAGANVFVAEIWTGEGYEQVLAQEFTPHAADVS